MSRTPYSASREESTRNSWPGLGNQGPVGGYEEWLPAAVILEIGTHDRPGDQPALDIDQPDGSRRRLGSR